MSNLLIVGAGASRAESISSGLTGNSLSPLDTDFFDLAETHAAKNNLDRIKTYLKDNYSIDLQNGQKARMEEAFGLIFADTLTEPMPKGAKLAFSALCRIYNRVIASTTNSINVTPSGPLSTLISAIRKSGPLTIITFNQDLVIERALRNLSGMAPGKLWYPDNGYEMNFAGVTSPSGGNIELFEESNGQDSSVKVLKMHGSLNWYTRTLKKENVPSKLTNSRSIYCTQRVNLTTDMTYNTGQTRGRKTWYTWPIIVPPIFEKGSFIGKVLSGVWNASFKAVKDSTHIFVYGYSFPPSDQQSEVFFRRATIANNINRTVSVINPDFSAVQRAHSVLSPATFMSSASVEQYLQDIHI